MRRITVAIDGYSSSGKSTMARELARRTGYLYVDSGAMYRAVALYALSHGMVKEGKVDLKALTSALPGIRIGFNPAGADGVQHTVLNGKDVEREIRDMEVSETVSLVAEIGSVRDKLTQLQKELGINKGIVMDGRDIGTTVFPDAEMKVFVEASPEERASRRLKEMTEKGEKVTYGEVLANIKERDHLDTTRKISPLRRAPDAHLLDNGTMSHDEQMDWLMRLFNAIVNE